MLRTRRISFALAALSGILAGGTAGYRLIEGWPALDALYMTVITVATVGFAEVRPLSDAGRVFTMLLIGGGVGGALFLLTQLGALVVDGQLQARLRRRAMDRTIARHSGHIVVCGYGRFGRVVVEELLRAGEKVVVIELQPASEAELTRLGVSYVIGSATSDDTLARAGVAEARAMVAATSSEADNVFVTLAAREMNPAIQIYARGESDAATRRLIRAGACSVTSPFHIGAQRVAAAILRPSVADFVEIGRSRQGGDFDIEEVRVGPTSRLAGRTVASLEESAPGVRVVAVKRAQEAMVLAPALDLAVAPGDHVVVIGARGPLQRLTQVASGEGRSESGAD